MFKVSYSNEGNTPRLLAYYVPSYGTDLVMVDRPVRIGTSGTPGIEMYPISNSTMEVDTVDGLTMSSGLTNGSGINIVLGYNIYGDITGVKIRQNTSVLLQTGSFPQSWQVVNLNMNLGAVQSSNFPLFKIGKQLVTLDFNVSNRKLSFSVWDEEMYIGFDSLHVITQNDFQKFASIIAAYKALDSTNYVTR